MTWFVDREYFFKIDDFIKSNELCSTDYNLLEQGENFYKDLNNEFMPTVDKLVRVTPENFEKYGKCPQGNDPEEYQRLLRVVTFCCLVNYRGHETSMSVYKIVSESTKSLFDRAISYLCQSFYAIYFDDIGVSRGIKSIHQDHYKKWVYLSCIKSVLETLFTISDNEISFTEAKVDLESRLSKLAKGYKRGMTKREHEYTDLVGGKYFARYFDYGQWAFGEFDPDNGRGVGTELEWLFNYFSRTYKPAFVVMINQDSDEIWRSTNTSIYLVTRNDFGNLFLKKVVQKDIGSRELAYKLIFYVFQNLYNHCPRDIDLGTSFFVQLNEFKSFNKNMNYDRDKYVNELKSFRKFFRDHIRDNLDPNCFGGEGDQKFEATLSSKSNDESTLEITLPFSVMFLKK